MKIKAGYHAEITGKKDLEYYTNLWAEIKDTWLETKDLVISAWNLALQIVELATALVPIVRTFLKRWIDLIRVYW